MAIVGLVIRPGIKRATQLGREVLEWAEQRNHSVMCESTTAKLLDRGAGVSHEELARRADPIVTLGGDGTLIGVARYVGDPAPVLLGVNFGNLGFLTEISPKETVPTLDTVLSKRASIALRSILSAEVVRGEEVVFRSQAVNDVVIQKGTRDRLLDIDFAVDQEDVMRMRGDGLIVATPTGSTAYSLAAGGSIVYPSLSVVLITPICAHSLTNRPLILSLDSILTATIPRYDGRVFVTFDGQVSFSLQSGDVIRVTRSKHIVKFVRSPHKSYFEILRTKLNWGIGNSAD